jgi:hypothetical protein
MTRKLSAALKMAPLGILLMGLVAALIATTPPEFWIAMVIVVGAFAALGFAFMLYLRGLDQWRGE